MGELGGAGGQQVVLGAGRVAARLQVHGAGCAGEERRAAREGELEQDHARKGLGILHDQVAGHRGRTGAGHQRHGHEAARQAVLGGHQVGLEVGTVVAERVDRALHEADDRPLAQLGRAADDGGRHLDEQPGRPLPYSGHRLVMLAGVGQHRLGVVQRLAGRRHVLRGDHRAPVVAHVGQGVDEARRGGRVGLGRGPLFAGVMVVHEHPAAVVGQVAVSAVDDHVASRIAAGQQVLLGHTRHRVHDDRAGQPGGFALAIDGAAVALENVERPRRRKTDADTLEDLERGLVDALDVAARQDVPAEPGSDGVDPWNHGQQPRGFRGDEGSGCERRPPRRTRRRVGLEPGRSANSADGGD